MRDRDRQRAMAEAKSRRATPEELREAGKRVKEIEQELLQIDLLPETKNGEDRESRYTRVLRLRDLRDQFAAIRPLEVQGQPNSLLLSVVMFVASFVLCAVCAGGAFVGVQFINQKPNPTDTANAFWTTLEGDSSGYGTIQSTYLSPVLRVQYNQQQFIAQALQADTDFGRVMSAVQTSQPVGDLNQSVTIKYHVTRGTHNAYDTTLTLTLHAGAWGIDDMGAAITPTNAGLPAPSPTPTTTTSPTGNTGQSPLAFQRDRHASRPTSAIAG
ncbi:MAG TPA: hypothetical protein VF510_03205 [Ktedonobacterales bacterium]